MDAEWRVTYGVGLGAGAYGCGITLREAESSARRYLRSGFGKASSHKGVARTVERWDAPGKRWVLATPRQR